MKCHSTRLLTLRGLHVELITITKLLTIATSIRSRVGTLDPSMSIKEYSRRYTMGEEKERGGAGSHSTIILELVDMLPSLGAEPTG